MYRKSTIRKWTVKLYALTIGLVDVKVKPVPQRKINKIKWKWWPTYPISVKNVLVNIFYGLVLKNFYYLIRKSFAMQKKISIFQGLLFYFFTYTWFNCLFQWQKNKYLWPYFNELWMCLKFNVHCWSIILWYFINLCSLSNECRRICKCVQINRFVLV